MLSCVAAVACSKSAFESNPYEEQFKALSHGMIELGDQLDNPYTVDNMTKAVESLYPTKAGRVSIDPTDVYVRFLPTSGEQYDALLGMGVELLDHPMDYEIVREGDYYHDPEVEEEDLTWQYAVVPDGFEFPDTIRYEILQDCYLPENDPSTKSDGIDWDAVERESFRLTGNGDMLEPLTKDGEESASKTPSGRITIIDERHPDELIGVKGVKVSCNVFVRFASGYTDADGNYKMNKSFSSSPRYRLVFQNKKGFGIGFNLILIPASISTLGRSSQEGITCTIDSGSNSSLYARSAVNNAVYDYFELCNDGELHMKTPPSNLRLWLLHITSSSSSIMLRQGAIIDGSILSDYLGVYTALVKMFLPDITVGVKGKMMDYASLYASTVHECAHASHYMVVGNDYWNTFIKYILVSFITSGGITYGVGTEKDHGYCEVAEMWGYYMEEKLYNMRYPSTPLTFGTEYWFSPQILSYLDERGMSRFKLFNAFTPEVTDRDALKSKLVSLYPEFKTTILQAFSRYN